MSMASKACKLVEEFVERSARMGARVTALRVGVTVRPFRRCRIGHAVGRAVGRAAARATLILCASHSGQLLRSVSIKWAKGLDQEAGVSSYFY